MIAGALTTHPMTPTRRENDARIGMVIFLSSWGMTFLTLFFSYAVLRYQSPQWPPAEVPPLPASRVPIAWINTGLVLVSSFFSHRAVQSLDASRFSRSLTWAGAAMLCGTGFLSLQIVTWLEMWTPGLRMSDGVYQALFYALTGFHALHIAAGIFIFAFSLSGVRRLAEQAGEFSTPLAKMTTIAGTTTAGAADQKFNEFRTRTRVRSAAMFWHFVGIAWIGTFFIVFYL